MCVFFCQGILATIKAPVFSIGVIFVSMFYRCLIAISFPLTAAIGKVFSQSGQYSFSQFDINNGLANNQVNYFYKYKQGFLWVGTAIGLNRYDGNEFEIYRHHYGGTTALSNDLIRRILEEPGKKCGLDWEGYLMYSTR